VNELKQEKMKEQMVNIHSTAGGQSSKGASTAKGVSKQKKSGSKKGKKAFRLQMQMFCFTHSLYVPIFLSLESLRLLDPLVVPLLYVVSGPPHAPFLTLHTTELH